MEDPVSQQVAGLVKRISHLLGRKVSEILMLLFNTKNAGSLGALAGFALAIVFAWKFLKPSDRPPQRKRRSAPSTSNSGLASVQPFNSEIYPQLLNLKEPEATDIVNHAVQLSLGQVVRKKLSGGRKLKSHYHNSLATNSKLIEYDMMLFGLWRGKTSNANLQFQATTEVTCQLLDVILEEKQPSELQEHATIRNSVLEVLVELAKSCDLYLMETVKDDESEEKVMAALEDAGLFRSGALVKEKVLFCSTENGRCSFVRQLEPDWHIDTNLEIVSNLARFIRYQLHISPGSQSILASNVSTSSSLEQFFSV